jgi:hypothetical protein
MSNTEAAKLMRVSERSVRRAKDKLAGKPPKPAARKPIGPGPIPKTLHNPLAAYQAKVRALVMANLPAEFSEEHAKLVDGLCELDPELAQQVDAIYAKERGNGAAAHRGIHSGG